MKKYHKKQLNKYIALLLTFTFVISFLPVIPSNAAINSKTPVYTTLSAYYGQSISLNYEASANASFVIPVSIPMAGELKLYSAYTTSQDYLVHVYADDSYINNLQTVILSKENKGKSIKVTAGASETIYLGFEPTETTDSTNDIKLTLKATLTPITEQTISAKKTLKSKTWTKKRIISSKAKHYYKIVVTKPSYITLNSNNTFINVQLLDKKKKNALSEVVTLKSSNNYHGSFALSKGTYYLKVTADYHAVYQLFYKATKVPKTYGTKITKSTKMTFDEQYLSVIPATAKTTAGQYYRFTLTKATKLQIAFYVENCSDKFKLEIFDENYEEMPASNYRIGNASLLYINSVAYMPEGTYYLRVTKTKATSSGCYSLMVRKK